MLGVQKGFGHEKTKNDNTETLSICLIDCAAQTFFRL